MSEKKSQTSLPIPHWQELLASFKKSMAKKLWALPEVSEKEKELLYKEILQDLDECERALAENDQQRASQHKSADEENNLLRSLLGVSQEDVKATNVSLSQEVSLLKKKLRQTEEERASLADKVHQEQEENEALRKHAREVESNVSQVKADQMKMREEDLKRFAENHVGLKHQIMDMEHRLKSLRELFTQTNEKMLTEKQEEITALQKRLLTDMESALQTRQQLLWAEEEAFAKGIAHKVRTALVSAQGQLFLTLERLGLMDADKKTESFWKSRLTLLMEGGGELAENFKAVQTQLHEVTAALDDYLHLTHRHQLEKRPLSVKELIQKIVSQYYVERLPTLNIEVLSDDPLPDIIGDTDLLEFCMKTVVENAVESLRNKTGRITISLKNWSQDGLVRILVQDDGSGIPEHLVPRLFEPFFSTKEKHQGLSLSRARRYVEMHGGTLELVRTGPDGTTFEMKLRLDGKG